MTSARIVGVCVLALVCSARSLEAQSLSHYRNFELGSDLASVSIVTGVAATEAKTTHERPALLQELEYRPSYWTAGSNATTSTDPVEQIAFGFYNDQLFRIVVDYSRERTEGMTDADLVEAISAVYGPVLHLTSRGRGAAPAQLENELGPPVAQWGDSQHSIVLYPASSYGTFQLIVTDLRLADLARKAAMQAVRLDDQEAPQREIARQQKERDDKQAAAAKARAVNRGAFQP